MISIMFYCSFAILKYICEQYKLDDHWYPSELRVRAKVDEYLSWHTGGIRCKCFYWAVSVPTLGCKYSFTGSYTGL